MGILDDAIREHLELKRRHGADSNEVSRQEREILGAGATDPAPVDDAPVGDYDEPAEPAFEPEPTAAAPEPLIDETPLAGSPLSASPEPVIDDRGDIFPGTGELLAAASETPLAPAAPRQPAPAPAAPSAPSLGAPAPSGADSETAARSGARRLSDDELAAWRRRLSERADRLAAQRPGTPDAPATGTAPATSAARDAAPKSEPPAYWSGNRTGSDAGAPPAAPAAPTADTGSHADAPESGVPVDFFEAGDAENAFAPEAAPAPAEAEGDVLDQTPDFLEETPEHDRMWFEQRPPRDFDFG